MSLARVYNYIDSQQENFLKDLFQLLKQRSISTQNDGIQECAELLATQMREVGIKTTIFPTKRHPVVYGEIGPNDGPVILIYGHYDVQPPEPLELWDSDPFTPVIRDGKIFARGSSDNKGQLFAHVKAIQAYQEVMGQLPLKVKFIFEGEEEISSPSLEPFVSTHKELLQTDICIFSDSHVQENGRPLVVLGLKGMLYVQITLKGANRDLHSMRAAAVPSPVWRLVHLLSSLKGEDGLVRIPGFYDDVRELLPEEVAAVEKIPCDKDALCADLEIPTLLQNRNGDDYYKNMIFEPTCNIAGLKAGYQGVGAKTVLPNSATAKLDLRLVPDQKPERILKLLKACLKNNGYGDAEVTPLGFLTPSRTPITHPLVQVAQEAVHDAYGVAPYIYPGIGGAGPNYIFEQHLGVPCFTIPFAAADQNNHAPNESLIVEGFFNGIKTGAALIHKISEFFISNKGSDSYAGK